MASSDLLAMCVSLTNSVLEAKKTAYINVRIGDNFNFTFNNQERKPLTWKKKKSPNLKSFFKPNFLFKLHRTGGNSLQPPFGLIWIQSLIYTIFTQESPLSNFI